MGSRHAPLEERLIAKIDMVGDCWFWTGAINRQGYGAFNLGRGRGVVVVHRFIWKRYVGAIPDALVLDHLCRIRKCVNPDHLEPVTVQENVDRGVYAAGLPRGDACRRGHLWTPENTKPNHGSRACRTCAIEANRRYRERQRSAA